MTRSLSFYSCICLGASQGNHPGARGERSKVRGLTAGTLAGQNHARKKKITLYRLRSHTNALRLPQHATAVTRAPSLFTSHIRSPPNPPTIEYTQYSYTKSRHGSDYWRDGCWCDVCDAYLVEAVHCRPPLAVRVQYFPAAVRKAHFLFSRQISTWNTSWSPSSS